MEGHMPSWARVYENKKYMKSVVHLKLQFEII